MDQLENLTVVIPTYNEEKTLPQILQRILLQKGVKEIIVVDDASTDNSQLAVQKLKSQLRSSKIRYILQDRNQGKGAAIQVGINNASGDLVLIQDADLEYHPEDYPKLLEACKNNPGAFVIGNRWSSKKGYLLCQVGNWVITQVINHLFWINCNDPYTCYKIGPTHLWREMNLSSTGFEIEGEIIAKLALRKVQIDEVLVRYSPRTYQDGKKIKAKDVITAMHTLFKIRIQNLPRLVLTESRPLAQIFLISSANTTKRCQSVPKGQQV